MNITRKSILSFATALLLTVVGTCLSTPNAFGQFPSSESSSQQSPMAGKWKVVNYQDAKIELEIASDNAFRMTVNGTTSSGKLSVSNGTAKLDFADGTKQEFQFALQGDQMLLKPDNSDTPFQLVRGSAGSSTSGFPSNGPDTGKVVVKPQENAGPRIGGTWYFKLETSMGNVSVQGVGKMEFGANQQFDLNMIVSDGRESEKITDSGRWSIQGNTLTTVSKDGTREEIQFQMQGDQLVLDVRKQYGTVLTLSRNKETVRSTSIDVKRLQEGWE